MPHNFNHPAPAAVPDGAGLTGCLCHEPDRDCSARSDKRPTAGEALYRALIEEQDELVSLAKPDGTLIYANPAYARRFGRTAAQMVGANLLDFVRAEDIAEIRRRMMAVFSHGGKTVVGETRTTDADDNDSWIEWTNKPWRDDQGRQVLHSVGRDITERKRLERRVADSERFARHVTDNLPMRIAYVDSQRRYQFVNEAHCKSFGLRRDEIIGRTRSELTQGPSDVLITARIEAALSGQHQQFEFEERVDGAPRQIEGQLIPDTADDGQVRGYFSANVDITDRVMANRALRELTAIFENTTDYVVQTDRRGSIAYMNPSLRRATGLAPEEPLAGRNFAQFNTVETNRIFNQVIAQSVESGTVWIGETTLVLDRGREVPVSHMVIAHRDAKGVVTRFSSVMRDISAEVESKREMLRQTATLRSVAEAIPATVAVFDADGRYRFANGAFERWVGLSRDRIIGRRASEVLGPDEWKRRKTWSQRAMSGERVTFELDYPGRDATHLSINYIPLLLDNGEVEGMVAVTQDVTRQKQEQGRLLQLSQSDALTGLLNRAGFEQALADGSGRGGADASLAILYIDLDRFKPVNDRYGHPTGDRTLQLFAQRLRSLVRPSDAVARLGGDEFAIALFGVQESANAQHVADKVVTAASQPFQVGSLMVSIGASVGIAFCANRSVPARELVEQADAQLLLAKAAGKGRHSGLMPL